MPQRPEELNERGWEVLRHVHRYQVTTERMIWSRYFSDANLNAARNAIGRLVNSGWLRKVRLSGQQKYVTLDTRGNFAFGIEQRARSRFSDQTLHTLLAMLHFCHRSGCERLTRADLRAIDPEFDTPVTWAHPHYVRDTDHGKSLSCCLVDRGAAPRRLVTRADTLIAVRYRIPKFRELIQARHFSVTLLTSRIDCVAPIQLEITEKTRSPVPIYIEVVPELAQLLPPPK